MNYYKVLKEGETNEFLHIIQRCFPASFEDEQYGFDYGRCQHIDRYLYVSERFHVILVTRGKIQLIFLENTCGLVRHLGSIFIFVTLTIINKNSERNFTCY